MATTPATGNRLAMVRERMPPMERPRKNTFSQLGPKEMIAIFNCRQPILLAGTDHVLRMCGMPCQAHPADSEYPFG